MRLPLTRSLGLLSSHHKKPERRSKNNCDSFHYLQAKEISPFSTPHRPIFASAFFFLPSSRSQSHRTATLLCVSVLLVVVRCRENKRSDEKTKLLEARRRRRQKWEREIVEPTVENEITRHQQTHKKNYNHQTEVLFNLNAREEAGCEIARCWTAKAASTRFRAES
jgi:hypothetical protein